jgi:hypothetical protein
VGAPVGWPAAVQTHHRPPRGVREPCKSPVAVLERDLRERTDTLHRRLRALREESPGDAAASLNTPEKKALALKKGLRKLRRAAHYARVTRAPTSPPLVRELRRIARSIDHDGLDGQMADLLRMVGAAVALEADTGAPVARRLAEAVARFEGVFAPPGRSAKWFVQQLQFRRRLRAQVAEMREKRRAW